MGSFGTWTILGKEPKLFAAAVPIAGGGSSGLASDLRKIPIWTFHGDADATCSVEDTRKIVEALEKARAPVKYTEMKGEGHGIPPKVYNDEKVHEWLFQQKKD
jgi:predicted peptidase